MNRYVLVTGASGGIGSAISSVLAENGYSVIVHYNKDEDNAKRISEDCRRYGVDSLTIGGNLIDPSVIEDISLQLSDMGIGIFGLVNNSGIYAKCEINNVSEEQWDSVMNVNLKATVFLTKKLMPLMENGGSIVNISSVSGLIVGGNMLSYEASKAALIHITRSMAISLAPKIRVNAVAPGNISAGFFDDISNKDEFINRSTKIIPLRRLGEGRDIGEIITFLISIKSSYITGQTIVVDGGLTLRAMR